jgi:hypothetical protein
MENINKIDLKKGEKLFKLINKINKNKIIPINYYQELFKLNNTNTICSSCSRIAVYYNQKNNVFCWIHAQQFSS